LERLQGRFFTAPIPPLAGATTPPSPLPFPPRLPPSTDSWKVFLGLGTSSSPPSRSAKDATLRPLPTAASPPYPRPLAGQRRPPSPSAPVFTPRAIFLPPGSLSRPPGIPATVSTTAEPPGPLTPTSFNRTRTGSALPATRRSKSSTGRSPKAYGRTPDRASLDRPPSRSLPVPPSDQPHLPHQPPHRPPTPQPPINPPHHSTGLPPTNRSGRRGPAGHAQVNGLRSRWIPPPTRTLGPRWIPPTPQLPPPLPPSTATLSPPPSRSIIDLTRPVYRKVFLSPGTKGFPPDRKRYYTKARLPYSHTFSRACGYVAYSSSAPTTVIPPSQLGDP